MIIETKQQENRMYELIGQQIKIKRIKLSMSQEILSEKSGISQKYLSFIESGRAKARLSVYINIANALDVPFGYLIEDLVENNTNLTIEATVLQMKKMKEYQQEVALDFMSTMCDFFKAHSEK